MAQAGTWFLKLVETLTNLWNLGQALVVTLVVVLFVLGKLPGARLIRRTLFQGQVLGPVRALRDLAACVKTLLTVAPTHVVRPRSLRRAVRVWVEMAIFDPRPLHELPPGKPWRKEWWKSLHAHRELVKAWKTRRRQALDQLIHGSQPKVIPVATCFQVHDAKDKLGRYFKTLRDDAADEAERFISTLKIKSGYLAPLHLVAGLLPNFGADWVPVIDDFGRALRRDDDPLRASELRSVQAFIFDCWLLWGPSIPLCRCGRWQGEVRALQLGYGDESNSIPLINRSADLFEHFQAFLAEAEAMPEHKAGRPLALQVDVEARPAWIPETGEGVPPALRGIVDGLALEHSKVALFGGTTVQNARLYYSAYLWVIFVIRYPDGRAVFLETETKSRKGEMWRGLLTFFEHGNIADGVTYDFMKEQLARKALSGLARLAENSRAEGWRFAYACAVDDPGCGAGTDTRRFPEPASSTSIRQRLAEKLGIEFKRLGEEGRVTVAPNADAVYSACNLTDKIKSFYDAVKEREPAGDER
jgi:hypothetical protein